MKFLVTTGVLDLNLDPLTLNKLFFSASKLHKKSYFLTYEPKGDSVVITDGNGNELSKFDEDLPTTIWVIANKYPEGTVLTVLLPEEY